MDKKFQLKIIYFFFSGNHVCGVISLFLEVSSSKWTGLSEVFALISLQICWLWSNKLILMEEDWKRIQGRISAFIATSQMSSRWICNIFNISCSDLNLSDIFIPIPARKAIKFYKGSRTTIYFSFISSVISSQQNVINIQTTFLKASPSWWGTPKDQCSFNTARKDDCGSPGRCRDSLGPQEVQLHVQMTE